METDKIIEDTPLGSLLEESEFPDRIEINQCYLISYYIINKLKVSQSLNLLTHSSDEIKLINGFLLKARERRRFEIQLTPLLPGPKLFQLVLSNSRGGKYVLWEKRFYAEDKASLNIEGFLKKKLPPAMKLGEKKEAIFLFANTGHQTITGLSIRISITKEG